MTIPVTFEDKRIYLPERNYASILAKKCKCSPRTVTTAIRLHAPSEKSKEIRREFHRLWPCVAVQKDVEHSN